MEILSHKNHQELFDFLPQIKKSVKEWILVDIRLTESSDRDFTITDAGNLIRRLYEKNEGKLYICNTREMILLLRMVKAAAENTPEKVAKNVESHLPESSCEVRAYEPTPQGIAKFEILITYRKPVGLSDLRRARIDKIIVVADDDMYMRMLVKKGAGANFLIVEVSDGRDVLNIYREYMPDILFLDVHLPNVEGPQLLRSILALDHKAYVIMLSADTSLENVEHALAKGAAGFLAKPFTKEKMLEYIRKCPTIPGMLIS